MLARILIFLSLSVCFAQSVDALDAFLHIIHRDGLVSTTETAMKVLWYIGLCIFAIVYGMLIRWTFSIPRSNVSKDNKIVNSILD